MKATSSVSSASEQAKARAGWDPYEVWSTRVRGLRIGANISVSEPVRPIDRGGSRAGTETKQRSHAALVWFTLALAIVLGLNRAIMGLFEVDLISDAFGVMTPTDRAVCVLLGGAALYCAIAMVAQPRR